MIWSWGLRVWVWEVYLELEDEDLGGLGRWDLGLRVCLDLELGGIWGWAVGLGPGGEDLGVEGWIWG